MRRFSIFLLLGLIVGGVAAGQSPDRTAEGTKIDEFGMVPDCEFKARVDALYIGLGNNEGAQGYVIIYRGARSAPARPASGRSSRRPRREAWRPGLDSAGVWPRAAAWARARARTACSGWACGFWTPRSPTR